MNLCKTNNKLIYGISIVAFVLIIVYFYIVTNKYKMFINNTKNLDQEELLKLIKNRNKLIIKHHILCGVVLIVLIFVIAFYTGSCVYCPVK